MSGDNLSLSQCTSSRSLLPSEASENAVVRPAVNLAAAARRNIAFLRNVADSEWFHHTPTLLESIRRYDELWMPLISDLTGETASPVVVPPFDVEWVWFCHSLNPVHYRKYCLSRFSKIVPKPAIFDSENEDYAFSRCRQIWGSRYPNEPFENETDPDSRDPAATGLHEDLLIQVSKKRVLGSLFLEPYASEMLYLSAANRRYQKFLSLLTSFSDGCSCLVPTVDILLIWITHMSYPTVYAADTKHIEDVMAKAVIGPWETLREENVEESKKLWESTFDQPYEKAGGMIPLDFRGGYPTTLTPVHWVASDSEDSNSIYKSMHPRFLLEVCVYVRLMSITQTEKTNEFLRLRVLKCHRDLKLDKPISQLSPSSWQKAWHIYCEFGTKGVMFELRQSGGFCFKGTGLLESASVQWNNLLRAPSLALTGVLDHRLRVFTSITPPVQGPYLLKCVPDRVTDDSGAMVSDLILRMNHYRPQEGRWLSRTVLDHAGRECFVVRIRIGDGFWRRGGESPQTVKWEDRIIEVREGSWSYVADSIGKAPEKIVGSAMPKEESLKERRVTWCLSTGYELTVQCDPTTTSFTLKNKDSTESYVKLLNGRKMQYERANGVEEDDHKEDGFVTLVRYTDESPSGKATALVNWKLLVVEFLPEEDAVFVLLLALSILRSVCEVKKEDVGGLLVRRRQREAKLGIKNWGSVTLHPCSITSRLSHLQPWHWSDNATELVSQEGVEKAVVRQSGLQHSLAEGGDKLYKRGIISKANE